MLRRRIALSITALLVGATLLSGCGGSGEDSAPSDATAGTTDTAVGTQQLLVNQRITVLDQEFAYPKKGAAQVSGAISTLEPGQETGWQQHRIPVFVHVMTGTYTVEYEAGLTKEFPSGSSFMQAVGVNYNGINKSEETVQLITVFMGAQGKRNTVVR